MADSTSFRVSNTVGLVTRVGVLKAQKTILGARGGVSHSIATIPIAGQSFGTVMGLFQKCIGVQWESLAAVQFDPGDA